MPLCPGPLPHLRWPLWPISQPCHPPWGAVIFPPVSNLGIGNSTQDSDVIMENAAMVPQALSAHATATVPQALSVHNTTVPEASPVYATAIVPQAS